LKTIKEIQAIIEQEGLGYAVLWYVNSEDIADKRLSELWSRAEDVLDDIMEYVESKSVEEELD